MNFLKLTSDHKFFSVRWENRILFFDWTRPLNLTDVDSISLVGFQLFPLESNNKGYAIRVYTNLILGELYNPKGEIADLYIPKSSVAIPKFSEPGESCMTHR